MQKAKKEDFRVEEELRSQKAKYEETSEDVYRRMQGIKEAEVDSIADLTAFLDAELGYYDRCRELLFQLKREWPAGYEFCASKECFPSNTPIDRLSKSLVTPDDRRGLGQTQHTPTLSDMIRWMKSQKQCPLLSGSRYARTVRFHQTIYPRRKGRNHKTMIMQQLGSCMVDPRRLKAQLS